MRLIRESPSARARPREPVRETHGQKKKKNASRKLVGTKKFDGVRFFLCVFPQLQQRKNSTPSANSCFDGVRFFLCVFPQLHKGKTAPRQIANFAKCSAKRKHGPPRPQVSAVRAREPVRESPSARAPPPEPWWMPKSLLSP